MPTRYTRRDAERAFDRLREAVGADLASDYGIHDPRREGAWLLDHNSVYGGYVIAAICKDSPPRDGRPQSYTSETHPLSTVRRNAREFCDYVNAVMAGMDLRERI